MGFLKRERILDGEGLRTRTFRPLVHRKPMERPLTYNRGRDPIDPNGQDDPLTNT